MPNIRTVDFFSKPTVLFLGAGASLEYGFPLGPRLRTDVLNNLSGQGGSALLKKCGIDEESIRLFGRALRYGKYETIDAFLEQKPQFRKAGSLLVANTLIQSERTDLFQTNPDGWYERLYGTLALDQGSPGVLPVSIVTLNYERSLEHYLRERITYGPDHIEKAAIEKLQSIPIVHAHGTLGSYPEVKYGDLGANNSDALLSAVRNAAESLRIVTDRLSDSAAFQEARRLVHEAKNIIFLGFGYHKATIDAMFAGCDQKDKELFGTAFGLAGTARDRVAARFGVEIHLGNEQHGCGAYLNEIGFFKAA